VALGDNALRELMSHTADHFAQDTIASTTTMDIGAKAAQYLTVTSTNTIAGLGTVKAGTIKFLKFNGALTLTHGASLILPGGVNIATEAGGTAGVVSEGSGNWRLLWYQRPIIPPDFIGMVFDFAGTTAPAGFLFCFGQNVSRNTYSTLFAKIGTTWGAGDGTTTFTLPDLRGRILAGKDDMGGVSANRLTGLSGGVNGDNLAAAGGAESHTLGTSEMPSHTHPINTSAASGVGINTIRSGDATGGGGVFATTATGNGSAHNNVQPTAIVNKIIYAGV
jgi:microcystin-dependent protein